MKHAACTLFLALAFWLPSNAWAQESFLAQQLRYSRVRTAEKVAGASLRQLLAQNGLQQATLSLYIRAFKEEETLEVWGASAGKPYVLLKTFDFCASSGTLGPKIASGDGQIPEGCYTVDRFNPTSNFLLSLGVSYPNAVDRARSGNKPTGGDIFLHGSCVTIGCIPITDEGIQQLYLFAVWARNAGQKNLPVHIFPAKLTAQKLADLSSQTPQWKTLWGQLAKVYQAFESSRTAVPKVGLDTKSGYTLAP